MVNSLPSHGIPTEPMSRSKRRLWMIVSVLCTVGISDAETSAATIDVGRHQLAPHTPGQVIEITVSGGEQVAGVNLFAQVGDGGPELQDFGMDPGQDGPSISALDLVTGTIFANANAPQDIQPSVPQVAIASVELTEPNTFAEANGVVAKLTIDTRGFGGGSWPLLLSNVLPGLAGGPFETDFAGQPIQIVNGSIVIEGGVIGDFDSNGTVDLADVDRLIDAIRDGVFDAQFNLNQDTELDFNDLRFMIDDLLETWFGDVNLDRRFDTTDLVTVFQAGEYEDQIPGNSTWARGDWNADGDFDSSDLVVAFTSNGFEQGVKVSQAIRQASAVPESLPSFHVLLLTILLVRTLRCRRWH